MGAQRRAQIKSPWPQAPHRQLGAAHGAASPSPLLPSQRLPQLSRDEAQGDVVESTPHPGKMPRRHLSHVYQTWKSPGGPVPLLPRAHHSPGRGHRAAPSAPCLPLPWHLKIYPSRPGRSRFPGTGEVSAVPGASPHTPSPALLPRGWQHGPAPHSGAWGPRAALPPQHPSARHRLGVPWGAAPRLVGLGV